jgi:phosphate-selective porin
MRFNAAALFLLFSIETGYAQTVEERLKTLEAEIQRLQQEVQSLKRDAESAGASQQSTPPEAPTQAKNRDFTGQILVPDLGGDEREQKLEGRPEIFLQTRFARNLVREADPEDTKQNFELTRIEVRWAGRISPRVGAGLEMQLHPAAEGSSDEILNDAFIEFYPARGVTLRAGQFVKPFGFDTQQSSSEREYPERAMFEGYFFPGERDRGVMFRWDLEADNNAAVRNTTLSAAFLNGNRFFADFDQRLNTVLRIRRRFPTAGLALGGSVEFGSQVLPSDAVGSSHVRILGLDFQYALRRFGTRVELIRGTRPSTLLSRDPIFTTGFLPGSHTSGAAVSGLFRLTSADQLYVRYDHLSGDPVSGQTVRATSAGYLRFIGEHAKLGLNYQWKNHPTLNDDAVNTRFQTTLGIVF